MKRRTFIGVIGSIATSLFVQPRISQAANAKGYRITRQFIYKGIPCMEVEWQPGQIICYERVSNPANWAVVPSLQIDTSSTEYLIDFIVAGQSAYMKEGYSWHFVIDNIAGTEFRSIRGYPYAVQPKTDLTLVYMIDHADRGGKSMRLLYELCSDEARFETEAFYSRVPPNSP